LRKSLDRIFHGDVGKRVAICVDELRKHPLTDFLLVGVQVVNGEELKVKGTKIQGFRDYEMEFSVWGNVFRVARCGAGCLRNVC
jgi:hypothetical protein